MFVCWGSERKQAKPDPLSDPFLSDERDRILDFFRERDPFYYPWVLLAFMAGLRPSEASALLVSDLNVESRGLSITKTRHLGADSQPKTRRSRRTIRVTLELVEALLTLPSFSLGAESLFLNKYGGPLDANRWAKNYWPRTLKALEIRPRKFYACRHTFITEAVKRGELLKAIADYAGTSVQMIEDHYCGTLELTLADRTVFEPQPSKSVNSLVTPTGAQPDALKKCRLLPSWQTGGMHQGQAARDRHEVPYGIWRGGRSLIGLLQFLSLPCYRVAATTPPAWSIPLATLR